MSEHHLIPELQALLEVVETKEANRQARLKISSTRLNDRGAAFVLLPEETQRAIVNLVRETTRLPRDPAIKDLQRQLDEKDVALEPLRQTNEELALLLNNRDNQLSDRGKEIAELRAMNTKMERELVECRKQKNVPREQQEATLTKERQEERAKTREATVTWTIDQRYEAFLQSAELYKEAVCECKTTQINCQGVTKQVANIRHKLSVIDKAIKNIQAP
ncbi:MAG: hypothetical protein Q8N04_19315 [Nitrospira sp.]|nr:hypothetical protein [Nitrospira sp.]